MEKRITAPLTLEQVKDLKAGDSVLISGVIYTARDAAHKRLCELAAEGKPMPFDVENSVIYYVGPRRQSPVRSSAPPVRPPATAWMPTLPRSSSSVSAVCSARASADLRSLRP